MALSATRLKNALKPDIEAQIRAFIGLGATPYPQLTQFSEALATAIANQVVLEVTSFAVVAGSASGTVVRTPPDAATYALGVVTLNGTVT